jgi:hypothetical protein
MDAEQTIAEIERFERIFANPDTRPLRPSDLAAANRRHDEKLAYSPWFRTFGSSTELAAARECISPDSLAVLERTPSYGLADLVEP